MVWNRLAGKVLKCLILGYYCFSIVKKRYGMF